MFSIECHQVLLLRHQERIHVGPSTKPGMGGLREVTGRRQTCWRMRPARRVCDGGASEVSRDGDLKLITLQGVESTGLGMPYCGRSVSTRASL